jgi:hypothetical protein
MNGIFGLTREENYRPFGAPAGCFIQAPGAYALG